MWQIIFTLHFPAWLPLVGGSNIPIYGYGVMMVLGFFAAMSLTQFLARRCKLDPELFATAALIALATGVAGARLSHVLENLGDYTRADLSAWQNFRNAINIRSGGLTYYGGFLLAFPSLVLYARLKKIPLRLGMDIIAPALMVGLAFGRVGCFMNGCCYGSETNVRWAVQFPYGSEAYMNEYAEGKLTHDVPPQLMIATAAHGARPMTREELTEREAKADPAYRWELENMAAGQKSEPVHPAQLYSTITAFLIAAFLLAYFTIPHVPGHVFAAMMMIEGVGRYLLEMLRVEPAVAGRGTAHLVFLPPQSFSMVVSAMLVVGGMLLWFVFSRMGGSSTEEPVLLRSARAVAA